MPPPQALTLLFVMDVRLTVNDPVVAMPMAPPAARPPEGRWSLPSMRQSLMARLRALRARTAPPIQLPLVVGTELLTIVQFSTVTGPEPPNSSPGAAVRALLAWTRHPRTTTGVP